MDVRTNAKEHCKTKRLMPLMKRSLEKYDLCGCLKLFWWMWVAVEVSVDDIVIV